MRFYSNALIKKYFKETSSYVKYEEPNEVIIFFYISSTGSYEELSENGKLFF